MKLFAVVIVLCSAVGASAEMGVSERPAPVAALADLDQGAVVPRSAAQIPAALWAPALPAAGQAIMPPNAKAAMDPMGPARALVAARPESFSAQAATTYDDAAARGVAGRDDSAVPLQSSVRRPSGLRAASTVRRAAVAVGMAAVVGAPRLFAQMDDGVPVGPGESSVPYMMAAILLGGAFGSVMGKLQGRSAGEGMIKGIFVGLFIATLMLLFFGN